MKNFALQIIVLIAVLATPAWLAAQDTVPPGTLLPVTLDTGLNPAKVHAGEQIRATLTQPIPDTGVRRGAKVLGQVVSVGSGQNGAARLEIRFDTLDDHGRRVPIRTSLRAMASFFEVQQAEIPEEQASRGLTPETWTTQQIGGDQVYRGGGPVAQGTTPVGTPGPWGAVGVPRTHPGSPCGAGDRPQALGLFSTDACGLYGFPQAQVDNSGRESGSIVLTGPENELNIRAGAALLLHVM